MRREFAREHTGRLWKLLVNLAGTAWLSARFLTRRSTFHQLERWQTSYLPFFGVWAATVVVVLPPAFSFG